MSSKQSGLKKKTEKKSLQNVSKMPKVLFFPLTDKVLCHENWNVDVKNIRMLRKTKYA